MNMNTPAHIAKHFREVHFGGNWTCVNLRDTLSDVSLGQAITKIPSFNTIAALTFHINYYVSAVLNVLQGGPLEAHDTYSYEVPAMAEEKEWQALLEKSWKDAEAFAFLLEQIPEEQLWKNLADEKYGTWYRNLHGIIEHTHYHLGQIVILKKLVALQEKNSHN
jgi:uncharacterized damage-inducible protein DinB